MTDQLPSAPPRRRAPRRAPKPKTNRPGLGLAALVILLATLPLLSWYLGRATVRPALRRWAACIYWPVRAGFTPWAALIDSLTSPTGNIAQTAPLVQWLAGLALFLALAFLVGLAFYAFGPRRGLYPRHHRRPDRRRAAGRADGFVALAVRVRSCPRRSLLGWRCWAWAGACCSATPSAGCCERPRRPSSPHPRTRRPTRPRPGTPRRPPRAGRHRPPPLPAAIRGEHSGHHRRDRGRRRGPGPPRRRRGAPANAADDQPGVPRRAAGAIWPLPPLRHRSRHSRHGRYDQRRCPGAEYPDRNYVIWLGGRSPIVIYENLETALAAYSVEGEQTGLFWLDS